MGEERLGGRENYHSHDTLYHAVVVTLHAFKNRA